ncbi:MAG: YraN family protein [Bacteroidales bacterium]|nr:YraN family protein [Bacteroidales bacterium]MCF8338844.1 YraN family protein [Bacteroidales bacterium]
MAEHLDLGQKGELLARDYLKNKGYQILKTNWRFGKDEIDIIAEDENYIVIVEVKTRSTSYFGEPQVFVNKQKQRFLIRAANAFIERSDSDKEVRFDIIAVTVSREKNRIDHIDDAFYPLV